LQPDKKKGAARGLVKAGQGKAEKLKWKRKTKGAENRKQ